MIKSITIKRSTGESLEIELADPEKSGFAISSIDGLGPTTVTLTTEKVAGLDGTLFSNALLSERQITMKVIPLFSYGNSVEERRLRCYKAFPLKRPFTLLVKTDTRYAYTTAYVKSIDPDIFSKTEVMNITLVCPDPYFYEYNATGGTLVTFNGIDDEFEFEFENDSLNEDMIEFGDIQTNPVRNIIYDGGIDVGITIHLHALGTATNFSFYNSLTKESMTLDTSKLPGGSLIAGDDIIISTLRGNKTVTLIRDGEKSNVINSLGKKASWFKLTEGDNVFIYDAETGMTNIQVTLKYVTAYEGV